MRKAEPGMKGKENDEEEAEAERIVCWRLGHLLEWHTAEQSYSPPLLLLPPLAAASCFFFTFCSQFDAADLAFVFTTLQGGRRNEGMKRVRERAQADEGVLPCNGTFSLVFPASLFAAGNCWHR